MPRDEYGKSNKPANVRRRILNAIKVHDLLQKRRNWLVGKRFGKLVVLERWTGGSTALGGVSTWKCQCDCGRITYPFTNALIRGDTRSCGKKGCKGRGKK